MQPINSGKALLSHYPNYPTQALHSVRARIIVSAFNSLLTVLSLQSYVSVLPALTVRAYRYIMHRMILF